MKTGKTNRLDILVKKAINEVMGKDRDVFTIRKNSEYFAHVTQEGDEYVTWGIIGEATKYDSLEEVFKELQGFDIHLDDIFWH